MSLTLAIVDNNTLLREAMAALLAPVAGLHVVAATACHASAIDALQASHVRVALIGVACAAMPTMDASRAPLSSSQAITISRADQLHANFDIAMRLMRLPAKPRVVMMNQVPMVFPKALVHAGVSCFVAADASLDELVKALRLAAMDQRYISPNLAQAWSFEGAASTESSDRFAALSARELEVLRYILADKRGVEIAEQLALSPKTVATYRSRVMEKLSVRSDIALLRLAQAAGLCS